jgi:hypothetical protein
MARWILTLPVFLLSACTLAGAAEPGGAPAEEQGPSLGVKVSPVPEILYAHMPKLRGGVVVTEVLPKSPAAEVGLRRHDILLTYGDKKIEDCAHLARLLRDSKPDQEIDLTLLREGEKIQKKPTLAKGPLLIVGPLVASAAKDPVDLPKGLAKPGAPARVNVTATPLGGGKMLVIIEFYKEGTGKLQTFTCSGTAVEIDSKVKELPQRVQDLALAALQRIRALDFHGDASKPPAAPSHQR